MLSTGEWIADELYSSFILIGFPSALSVLTWHSQIDGQGVDMGFRKAPLTVDSITTFRCTIAYNNYTFCLLVFVMLE